MRRVANAACARLRGVRCPQAKRGRRRCVLLPALAFAVLASSSDADCSAAMRSSEVTWRRSAALRWRRHVSAVLHFRLREGEGVERAALAVAP